MQNMKYKIGDILILKKSAFCYSEKGKEDEYVDGYQGYEKFPFIVKDIVDKDNTKRYVLTNKYLGATFGCYEKNVIGLVSEEEFPEYFI